MLDKIKQAIAQVESGGSYDALNSDSNAIGKYQFVWSHHGDKIENITGASTPNDFLESPQAQEKYMNHWAQQTLIPSAADLASNNDIGIAKAAALVHYQGPGRAEKVIEEGAKGKNRENNLPVDEYLKRFSSNLSNKSKASQYSGNKLNSDDIKEINKFAKLDYNGKVNYLKNNKESVSRTKEKFSIFGVMAGQQMIGEIVGFKNRKNDKTPYADDLETGVESLSILTAGAELDKNKKRIDITPYKNFDNSAKSSDESKPEDFGELVNDFIFTDG